MEIHIPTRQLFIDGEWRDPILEKRISIVNPATGDIIGGIPAATKEDVDAAVDAARRAFSRNNGEDWANAPGAVRAKYLLAIATKVRERKTDLARFEALDCGIPLEEAKLDMDDVARCFEYYAIHAELLDDRRKKKPVFLVVKVKDFRSEVQMQPIGVVGLITPCNHPLLMAAWKVAPSLAAGCTAVLKPSELASVTCLELADICKEVGLPPGVLNVITGYGSEAGAPLASHPCVDKIAFTGSSATGSKVMTAAAKLIKPVSMELGGKSPLIVFDDVNLDTAVEWALFGCFRTNGQISSATSRLLVHENIASEFIEKLVDWTKNIKISDPLEQGCRLGPVISKEQHEKILKFISRAVNERATILHGGSRPEHLEKGYFIEPTIITDVTTSMQIWREEVFGPVLCVKTFASEDEAIELANDSQYGLGAAVISNDLERCDRISQAFEAGIVWINCSQPCFHQAPWGGVKRSGVGRELGEWGIDNYLSVKQVTHYISDKPWGWYKSPY